MNIYGILFTVVVLNFIQFCDFHHMTEILTNSVLFSHDSAATFLSL